MVELEHAVVAVGAVRRARRPVDVARRAPRVRRRRAVGLDAARAIPGGRETFDLLVNIDGDTTPGEFLPLHPHNGFLQIWLELGLPGILLVGFVTLAALRAIHKHVRHRFEKACVAATCVAGILLFELSFGAWQGWWQATLWVAAALTIAVVTRPMERESGYSATRDRSAASGIAGHRRR